MLKIVILYALTALWLIGALPVSAQPGLALPDEKLTVKNAHSIPSPSFPVSNRFSRSVQTLTGVRFLTGKIAEGIIARELKQQFQKKPRVKLQLYSAGDLVAGKLKGVTVSGKHLVLGIPFTELLIQTEDPLWLKLDKKPYLMTPVRATFESVLTEADVNKTLAQQPTRLKLKLPAFGEQTLLALAPRVRFADQTIQLDTRLTVPGANLDTALPLSVEGQLQPSAERNRLVWKNLKVSSPVFQSPELVSQFMEQQFGKVISFTSQQVNGHPLRVAIISSRIQNQSWRIKADMTVLPPKPPAQR